MVGIVSGLGEMVGDTGLGVTGLGGKGVGVGIDGIAAKVGFGRTKSVNGLIKRLLS